MRLRAGWILTWTMLLIIALAGCNGHRAPKGGPMVELSTPELIKRINDNNALIRNLWSRLDITVQLPGEKHSVAGHLILRKPSGFGQEPRDLLLKGGDTIGAVDFQIGSNTEKYWYMLDAPGSENDVYRCVSYNQSEAGTTAQALDLLSVLGVYELPAELNKEPWPMRRGYDEPPYYVISFVQRLADDSLRVRKDIWWNRRTQQVDLIELFDEEGQRYLSAALDDYQRFEGAQLATNIRVVWFVEKLTLELKLKDVQINSEKVSDKNFVHCGPGGR